MAPLQRTMKAIISILIGVVLRCFGVLSETIAPYAPFPAGCQIQPRWRSREQQQPLSAKPGRRRLPEETARTSCAAHRLLSPTRPTPPSQLRWIGALTARYGVDMGNEASLPLELVSNFDADEIRRLGKRFRKLDLDGSGSLTTNEFMLLPELQQNPLVHRVIELLDSDGNGEIDFKEFIDGVSQFSVKGNKEAKLQFAFRIYDIDKDGFISNGELFQVLKMMVGSNLKDTQLQQIVDKTIIYADKDGDGKISFAEFCEVVGSLDVHKKMVVDV